MQNGRGGTGLFVPQPGRQRHFLLIAKRLIAKYAASEIFSGCHAGRIRSTSARPRRCSPEFRARSVSNETGATSRTQIYGADLLYKWKSTHAEGGFPFVKWQTEAMYRRFEAGRGVDESFPVAETFHDWGMYSQVVWGFKKGWVAGVRGDYLHMQESQYTDDDNRQSRSRVTRSLTWYPTEFSKIRLQYNHDFLEENVFLAARDVDSVFLQLEFILGAHGAHKF